MMTLAHLKEIAEALGHLERAGIKRHLTDVAPWTELQAIRREWQGKPNSKVRDSIMFHFGHPHETTEVLTKETKDASALRAPLLERDREPNDGRSPPYYYSPASEALLLKACDLTPAMLSAFMHDGLGAAYERFLSCVIRIVTDLLQQCGARMPPLERGVEGIFG
jgi:hypothetical protein